MAGRWKEEKVFVTSAVFVASAFKQTSKLKSLDVCIAPIMYGKTNRSILREPTTVLDSGFHARDSFQIPGNGFQRLCQCNLDSGFQSLVGFRIPRDVLRIPNPGFRIPQAKI